MIIGTQKLKVISVLDSALGVGTSAKGNEQIHFCPFCHHHKKKLQINLNTQHWHCWVCDASGIKIKSLLRKLKVDSKSIQTIKDIYGDDDSTYNPTEDYPEKLELPKDDTKSNTTTYVILGIVGVALLGAVMYFASKKRS